MSKELTLEELAASVPTANQKKTVVTNKQNNKPAAGHGSRVVSTTDISNALRAKEGIPTEGQVRGETIDAPLVTNAFNGMQSTIENKKKRFEEEVLPIIEENAREMAAEAELGVDVSKVKLDDEAAVEAAREAAEKEFEDDVEEADEEVDLLNEDEPEDDDEEVEEVIPEAPKSVAVEEVPVAKKKEKKPSNDEDDDNEDEEDLTAFLKDIENEANDLGMDDDDDDEEDFEEESAEETRERFRKNISDDIRVTDKPISINNFKISRAATSSADALKVLNSTSHRTSDWALYHTGRSMTFKEATGSELDNLRSSITGSNSINNVIRTLRFVYDHVVDANKPDFESWCKLIRTEDVESLYFGIYKACYEKSNLLPRECSAKNCNKSSIIKADINSMVKFDTDETKEKFYNILSRDTTTDETNIESTMLQISDDIVISYSMPTLYSTFIQFSAVNQKIVSKYQDTLNTMAYIDGFYIIDRETQTLTPIAIKKYPKSISKSVTEKLRVYLKVLSTLTADQYNMLMAKLASLTVSNKVSYVYPTQICPECGATIKEEPIGSILQMVFIRAQLATVKNL